MWASTREGPRPSGTRPDARAHGWSVGRGGRWGAPRTAAHNCRVIITVCGQRRRCCPGGGRAAAEDGAAQGQRWCGRASRGGAARSRRRSPPQGRWGRAAWCVRRVVSPLCPQRGSNPAASSHSIQPAGCEVDGRGGGSGTCRWGGREGYNLA